MKVSGATNAISAQRSKQMLHKARRNIDFVDASREVHARLTASY